MANAQRSLVRSLCRAGDPNTSILQPLQGPPGFHSGDVPGLVTGKDENGIVVETDPDVGAGFWCSLAKNACAQRLAVPEAQGNERGMPDQAPFDHPCTGTVAFGRQVQSLGAYQDIDPLAGDETVGQDVTYR